MPLQGYPQSVWNKQVTLSIKRNGKYYVFSKSESKDRFGQPDTTRNCGMENSVEILGIYHEEIRWTRSVVSEGGGSNVNKFQTEAYILCEKSLTTNLSWGMTTQVGDKTYRLIKSRDIEAMDLFCDLVLEEVEPNGLSDAV